MINNSNDMICNVLLLVGLALLVSNVQMVSGLLDLPIGFRPVSLRNPKECARELDSWCRSQDFDMHDGFSSRDYQGIEPGNGFSCSTSGSAGIRCRKGNRDWFHCRSDNVFMFDGRRLMPNSATDPEICRIRNSYFNTVHKQKQQDSMFQKSMDGMLGGMFSMF